MDNLARLGSYSHHMPLTCTAWQRDDKSDGGSYTQQAGVKNTRDVSLHANAKPIQTATDVPRMALDWLKRAGSLSIVSNRDSSYGHLVLLLLRQAVKDLDKE
jgi:hypothetical protein